MSGDEGSLGQIEDPDDYNQRQRLQSIGECHTQVLDIIKDLENRKDQLGEAQTAKDLFSATEAFIIDIGDLVANHGGEKYYTKPLGKVVIHPPSSYMTRDGSRTHSLSDDGLRVIGDNYPKPVEKPVNGLFSKKDSGRGFLEFEATVQHSWPVDARIRHRGKTELYGTASSVVPVQVSKAAFRLGKRFLNESGLDARIGETDHDPNPV